MTMTIFFLLNGMGVVFLLYVLGNFWKEGRRPRNSTGRDATELSRSSAANGFVLTHPIFNSDCGAVSAIRMQALKRDRSDMQDCSGFVEETDEMLLNTRRIYTS